MAERIDADLIAHAVDVAGRFVSASLAVGAWVWQIITESADNTATHACCRPWLIGKTERPLGEFVTDFNAVTSVERGPGAGEFITEALASHCAAQDKRRLSQSERVECPQRACRACGKGNGCEVPLSNVTLDGNALFSRVGHLQHAEESAEKHDAVCHDGEVVQGNAAHASSIREIVS